MTRAGTLGERKNIQACFFSLICNAPSMRTEEAGEIYLSKKKCVELLHTTWREIYL